LPKGAPWCRESGRAVQEHAGPARLQQRIPARTVTQFTRGSMRCGAPYQHGDCEESVTSPLCAGRRHRAYLLAVTESPTNAAMSSGFIVPAAWRAEKATGAGGASSMVRECGAPRKVFTAFTAA